jgi:[glutamine synthetase] adenylyltransferase / [glutamine synthetase]-adenylyl-L-tyrosine phosphorylase
MLVNTTFQPDQPTPAWFNFTSTRSEAARLNLAALRAQVAAIAQSSEWGDEISAGFDNFVRELSVGTHLFALLADDVGKLTVLLELITRSPRLAAAMASRPDLFDVLVSRRRAIDGMSIAEVVQLIRDLKLLCESNADYLQRIQRFNRTHHFLISARIVMGWMPIHHAEEAYSKLAFATVVALAGLAEQRFRARHGRVPGAEWALVALGKFGGFELTATSDLDLMLVYDSADQSCSSDGARPLSSTQYFNQLAQSIIRMLQMTDREGPLFDVDFRLRPWGNKGPIATRLPTLRDYLQQESWTYEHMAMTRARVIMGPPSLSAAVEDTLHAALRLSAERPGLKSDIREMHALMHSAKETDNPWHIKSVRGGLTDVEFVTQYLLLRHAGIRSNIIQSNTSTALFGLLCADLLGPNDFNVLSGALSFFKSIMQIMRAAGCSEASPDVCARYLCEAVGERSLGAIETRLRVMQSSVLDTFGRLIGG